jgi:FkbM family methyltransferase
MDDFNRWKKDNGPTILRYEYDLNEDSIVFDVGGYQGSWCGGINKLYGSKIHVFEPVKQFYNTIVNKFKEVDNVIIHNFGLLDTNTELDISLNGDASSVNGNSGGEKIKLVDIMDFIDDNNIEKIDLIKLNIEGAEYKLLEKLVNSDFINKVGDLQIQFHANVLDYQNRRKAIRKTLSETHVETYCYDYIWENWSLKK